MLLSEQVRMIQDEEVLVYDTTLYQMTANTWTTLATKNITTSKALIVYVSFRGSPGTGPGSGDVFQLRVLLDGVRIMSTGGIIGATTVDREVYLYLSAGSYSFAFQGTQIAGTVLGRLTNIRIATLNFPDKDRKVSDSGPVSCPNGATTTVLNNYQPTIPATRKLAVGSIKKYVCIITAYIGAATYRRNKPKNPGESNESGFFNWKIYMNGTQQSWTERLDDQGGTSNNDANGSTGAYARLVILADPGVAPTIRIDAYNGTTTDNASARVDIHICPWFLAGVYHEPVSLDFPQGSTIYVYLEPLGIQYNNPTKYASVGKARFVSFGDATDYYKTVSGTGILSLDYTFEIVEVVNSVLHVKGLGGCISALGVDMR